MSIVTDRIYEDASGVAACASCPAAVAKSYLVEALGTPSTVDVGVIIVNGEARSCAPTKPPNACSTIDRRSSRWADASVHCVPI